MSKKNKLIQEVSQKGVKKALYESSLNRIRQHMQDFDTGFITAFRSEVKLDDGTIVSPTKKENLKRNEQLFASLNRKYDITKVQGKYIENYGSPKAKEVGENTFFVVDSNLTGDLENDLKSLGEKFQQDSILFIPKGVSEGILWGTNKAQPQAWPGYGKSLKIGHPVFGQSGQIMTKIKGRPFIFKEGNYKEYKKYYNNWLSELGRQAFIDSDWRD